MELRGIKLLLLWSILVLSANVATGKKKKKLEIIVEVGRMERSCPILYCMLDPFASYSGILGLVPRPSSFPLTLCWLVLVIQSCVFMCRRSRKTAWSRR